jgi:hypothetical protein
VTTLPSLLTRNPLPCESGLPDASDVTITTLALVADWEIVVMSDDAVPCAQSVCAHARTRMEAGIFRILPRQGQFESSE